MNEIPTNYYPTRHWLFKLTAMTVFWWISFGTATAQTHKADSLSDALQLRIPEPTKADALRQHSTNKADSLENIYQHKLISIDSAQRSLQQNNIVSKATQKVDSLQANFNQRSDSLQNAYRKKLNRLESSSASLQKTLDSLTTLKLSSNGITKKLDSLNKLREATTADFQKKLQSIKDKTASKLKDLDLPPEVNDKVNSLTKNMDAVNVQDVKLGSLNLSGNPLQEVDGLGKLNDLPGADTNTALPRTDLTNDVPGVDIPQGVNVQSKVLDASKVTGKVSSYTQEADQVVKENANKVTNIPKTAEEKAAELSGIKNVEKQSDVLSKYKDLAAKSQDPEALKKEAREKAKQVAVNHFAGKEEQLKAAMEKVAKYKQKYSSLKSVSDLSKKPKNEMHGKPLVERIVPGVALQFQKRGDDLLIDFNLYAAYRLTKRINAGLGWNQRLGYNTDVYSFSPNAPIFGPRMFGEFKLGKGFSSRGEIELMNTGIPPLNITTYDPSQREWIWGAFLGIKKEYKLFKNVKGTSTVMARLFNQERKSPYADVVNVRVGFEFPMKKKKTNKSK